MVSCFSFCHILRNGSCIMKPVRTLTPLVIRRWVEIKTFFCCGPIQPTTTEFFSTVTMRTAEQEGSGIVAELSRTGWTTGREKKKWFKLVQNFVIETKHKYQRDKWEVSCYWVFTGVSACVDGSCELCVYLHAVDSVARALSDPIRLSINSHYRPPADLKWPALNPNQLGRHFAHAAVP